MKKLWIASLTLCGFLSLAGAESQTGYLPGEFSVVFRAGVQAEPREERGLVRTGIAPVDALNSKYGVYAALPAKEPGTYIFKVPTGTDIGEAVAAYRELTEPVRAANGIFAIRPGEWDADERSKQRIGGVLLAANAGALDPAALFEGRRTAGGLSERADYRPQESTVGAPIRKITCNPALDDDCGPRTPAPRTCNPALDDNCPGSTTTPKPAPKPQPSTPRCNPGINCPGDDPRNAPRAPSHPPVGWSQRPSGPPRRWDAPPSDTPFYEHSVDGYWRPVAGFFGWALESYGSWGDFQEGHGSFQRDGAAVHNGQGKRSHYTVEIKSSRTRTKYRRYYQHAGRNCRDYDGDTYCEDWDIRYAWFPVDVESQSREALVDVAFENDQELLPWESERFAFYYDGNRISPRVGDRSTWAYDYRIEGPRHDNSSGKDGFVVRTGPRKPTSADPNGVTAGLQVQDGQVKLVVNDAWAMYYKGQPNLLDLYVRVYKKCTRWFCSDDVVFDSAKANPSLRIDIPDTLALQPGQRFSWSVPVDRGPGKYYVHCSWGSCGEFRRYGSAISDNSWHGLTIERGQQEVSK